MNVTVASKHCKAMTHLGLIFFFSLGFFRRLKTKEKAIHKQLYLAMLIQVVVRLILYTDQIISRKDQTVGSEGANQEETRGIDNTVGITKSGLFPI